MRQLVENIVSDNLVTASRIFESRLDEIVEKKLYEKKKQMQAEAFGGMSKDEIQARKDAGYIKASDYFDAMNRLKNIQKKASGQSEPKKTKKKLKEAFVSPEELKKRAASARERLTGQVKKTFSAFRTRHQKATDDSPFPSGMHQTQTSSQPGRLQRNINTLLGREPDYTAADRDPVKQGGRVGRAIRGAAGRVAGEIASYSNLE